MDSRGKIYGRPATPGGRPAATEAEQAKKRRDLRIGLSVFGAILAVGLCCGCATGVITALNLFNLR